MPSRGVVPASSDGSRVTTSTSSGSPQRCCARFWPSGFPASTGSADSRRPRRGLQHEPLVAPARDVAPHSEVAERGTDVEPGRCPCKAHDRTVAAPAPPRRLRAEAGPDRVHLDVALDVEPVLVAVDELAVEAAVEDMAVEPMAPVEPLSVRPVKPLHA